MTTNKKGKPGKRVESLAELVRLADTKRAVVCPSSYLMKPSPAAFVVCFQGREIDRLLSRGLYVWETAERNPSKPPWPTCELVKMEGEDNNTR